MQVVFKVSIYKQAIIMAYYPISCRGASFKCFYVCKWGEIWWDSAVQFAKRQTTQISLFLYAYMCFVAHRWGVLSIEWWCHKEKWHGYSSPSLWDHLPGPVGGGQNDWQRYDKQEKNISVTDNSSCIAWFLHRKHASSLWSHLWGEHWYGTSIQVSIYLGRL